MSFLDILGGLVAGNPGQSFQQGQLNQQKISAGDVDAQGQAAAGRALMSMVPGAQPMQPSQPGSGIMTQGGNPLAKLSMLLRGANQAPAAPPVQPLSAGPMPQGVPGAQPMSSAPQPGMTGPPGGMPPPGGLQAAPGGLGGQGGGQPALDWRTIVQQVIKANPGVQDPRVIAAAVDRFMPIMNQQSQMEWRAVALGIRQQQVEQQGQLGQQRLDVQREGIQQRADTASQNRVSRETIAQMSIDERREAYQAGVISREQMDEANRNERAREADQRATVSREAETGREHRAELSTATKQELSKLSIQARKEIEAARLQVEGIKEEGRTARAAANIEDRFERTQMTETGKNLRQRDAESSREDIAALSAKTRAEVAKLSANARQELSEYLEGGRMQRFEEGQTTRRDLATQAETGRESRSAASLAERHGEFQQREIRLDHASQVRQDQGWQRLELQKAGLERQIIQGGQKQLLGQWRAILDAQHKKATEIIQAQSLSSGMSPADQKKLVAEEDAFYTGEIKRMRGAANGETVEPTKVKTPEEAAKLAPGTHYVTPDGQEYTR